VARKYASMHPVFEVEPLPGIRISLRKFLRKPPVLFDEFYVERPARKTYRTSLS
jgi:hypothetical protein